MVANAQVRLHGDTIEGDQENLSFHPTGIAGEFDVGDLIDIDFHGVQLRVTEKSEAYSTAVVETPGKIGENKAVSVNRQIPMPAMTEKDQRAIEIGRRLGIQYFALSFANAPEDVDAFRSCIGDEATLITKIESIKGVRNLIEIADMADALLVVKTGHVRLCWRYPLSKLCRDAVRSQDAYRGRESVAAGALSGPFCPQVAACPARTHNKIQRTSMS